MILTSADCAEHRTAAVFLSLKASATIGLMDDRMEMVVIPLFVGEVVGLDTGWIGGHPVGGAGDSAGVDVGVGASVRFDAVFGTGRRFGIESNVGGGDSHRSVQLECGIGSVDWIVVSATDSFDLFEVSLVGVICMAFIWID